MKKNLMNIMLAMVAVFLTIPMAYAGSIYDDFLKDTKYSSSDGQNVSMVSYDANNKKYTYSGIAVNFSTHVVENNVTQTTPTINDGDWFTAFCADPFQGAKIGGSLGVNLIAPSKVEGGLQAAWLFENYYEKNPATVAALQVAIWEVIVDNHADAYDLTQGNFYLNSLNGKARTISTTSTVKEVVNGKTVSKKITTTTLNPTWGLAESMLADLEKNYNAKDLDYMYRISQTSTNQDFIIRLQDAPPAGTPEPATMILMGIGILGLAGFRKFRKN